MKRLKELLKERNISGKDFAATMGVSPVTISRWISGEREPDIATLAKIADALGVTLVELIDPSSLPDSPASGDDEETVQIPICAVSLSAGNGVTNDLATIKNFLTVERRVIREELGVDPDRVVLVQVHGDSMEPDLHNRDYVFIDREDRYEIREGFYALHYDGTDFVKRLQRLPDGGLNILSSNPVYPPIRIDPKSPPEGFRIAGRVLGFIHLKKV